MMPNHCTTCFYHAKVIKKSIILMFKTSLFAIFDKIIY